MNSFLLLVLGVALPILLWPIEYFFPFPYLVEELAKFLGLMWFKSNLRMALLFALLFTLSESVLYTFNFFMIGQLHLFPKRLLLTGLLHTVTVLVLFAGSNRSRFWQVVTLLAAVGIHYTYNSLIATIF